MVEFLCSIKEKRAETVKKMLMVGKSIGSRQNHTEKALGTLERGRKGVVSLEPAWDYCWGDSLEKQLNKPEQKQSTEQRGRQKSRAG